MPASKSRRLSCEASVRRMVELWNAGWSQKEIQRHFGDMGILYNLKTVNWYLWKERSKHPDQVRHAKSGATAKASGTEKRKHRKRTELERWHEKRFRFCSKAHRNCVRRIESLGISRVSVHAVVNAYLDRLTDEEKVNAFANYAYGTVDWYYVPAPANELETVLHMDREDEYDLVPA